MIRAGRVLLVLLGVAAVARGAWLLAPQLTVDRPTTVSFTIWLAGGPVLHDFLLAPVVAAAGIAVATAVPPRWRAPIAAGLVVSGALLLVALPIAVRPAHDDHNPGLSDRNYPVGIAIALSAIWLTVLITTWTRRAPNPHGPHART